MDALGYGLAWRVLDAQFFNVAQRRERVFLVGCLGDKERAAEVLFERESLCWDHPSSREKRKSLAASSERGIGGSVGNGSFCIQGDIARGAHMGQNGKGWSDTGESYTLNTMDVHVVAKAAACTMLVRCGCEGGGKGALIQDDMSATLSTSNTQTLFQPMCIAEGVGGSEPIVASEYVVRRLTPVECERLQGFPDGWTDIEWKGKKAPDGKRYKALGNSMAVPVMRWIGQRIDMVELALHPRLPGRFR